MAKDTFEGNVYRGNKTNLTKAPNADVVKPKVTQTEGKDLRSK